MGLRHEAHVHVRRSRHSRNAATPTLQFEAFKTGQLAKYLVNSPKTMLCPKDVVESSGSKKNLYLQRPIKITSYDWSGHVGGYVAALNGPQHPPLAPAGKTFKLSAFVPSSILQWEKDDLVWYYFNDAGNAPWEGISQRHAGGNNTRVSLEVKGGAAVGCMDGHANNLKYRRWYETAGSPPAGWDLNGSNIKRVVPAPNDLYYDPRDKWGGAQHIPAVDGP